jgi:fatty-acid desaturase
VRIAAAFILGLRTTLFWAGQRQGVGDRPKIFFPWFSHSEGRINWTTGSFLIGTFFLTLTAVPLHLWYFGVDWFHVAVFAVLLAATGFSIPLGYHRLFSHMTFRARLPVRLLDPLVMWQHRHTHLLAVMMSFGLPTLAGFMWDGWGSPRLVAF